MQEIRADAKTVRALLGGAKYSIDYYQREYRWERKHLEELITDLAEQFLDSHDPANSRSEVENYGRYFLGSIIVSHKEGKKILIDGQQRLTTLTLLLIYIYRQLDDENQKAQLAELIFSQKYGRRSFNLDIEERNECMEALFTGTFFDENGQPEAVVNILRRYQDIEELFPDELRGDVLPYFADWLIENVYLVEITASNDTDAYTIFETMNDRGLSLTPTDMLKGYLLANISDTEKRNQASDLWRKRVKALQDLGKDEEASAIKAWLRSQYAQTIRERKRHAQPKDFDLIGTEFHRWVRDHEKEIGLTKSDAFYKFIQDDFTFYTRWYERLRKASQKLESPFETVFYNAQYEFTLQYPVLLAPLRQTDSELTIECKIRIVAAFLDILINRRIWNWRAIDYSTMQYAMFIVMREIRGADIPKLLDFLIKYLKNEVENFRNNPHFRLHGTNRRQVHRILARLTDYVETQSGRPSRYSEYIQSGGKGGYQIEHIWANHFERHTDEFTHPSDFEEYRNRIGGLLLLPRSFNASYSDLEYPQKRQHYLKQNLLAASLHDDAYQRDPGFIQFVRASKLPFTPHPEFKKENLDARQELYIQLAERVWDVKRLQDEAARSLKQSE